jgi:hypothetical protein
MWRDIQQEESNKMVILGRKGTHEVILNACFWSTADKIKRQPGCVVLLAVFLCTGISKADIFIQFGAQIEFSR